MSNGDPAAHGWHINSSRSVIQLAQTIAAAVSVFE